MSGRVTEIKKNLKDGECAYIKRPENVFYYSGFAGEGALVVSKNKNVLITDFRYIFDAKKCEPEYEICDIKDRVLEYAFEGIHTIYIEDDFISLKEYNRLKEKFKDITVTGRDFSLKQRMIKDKSEIENIKKASNIAEKAFEKLLSMIDENITEKDLACEFEYLIKKSGAQKTSFDTIVASGVNSSMPHAVVSDKKICAGDFITFDFGCVYNGYCSDMTRTVAYKSATDKMKNVYDIVLEAQLAGINSVASGIRCCDVDKAARDIINKNGYKDNFGHALGHGVGLFIHESPSLSPRCETVLEDNMVVTVEPGIYIENEFGIRIEDLTVVSGKKADILTKFEKKLIII